MWSVISWINSNLTSGVLCWPGIAAKQTMDWFKARIAGNHGYSDVPQIWEVPAVFFYLNHSGRNFKLETAVSIKHHQALCSGTARTTRVFCSLGMLRNSPGMSRKFRRKIILGWSNLGLGGLGAGGQTEFSPLGQWRINLRMTLHVHCAFFCIAESCRNNNGLKQYPAEAE